MWLHLLSVARNAFTESLRQPVYAVLLLGTVLLLAVTPMFCAYTFNEDDKLLADLGLSTLFVAGLLLAAFTAAGVFSREIENQTVLTVISKPVSRPVFVLGKYLGVTAALGVAYWIWALVFLLTVRHRVMTNAFDPWDYPVLVLGSAALGLGLLAALWCNYFYGWVFSSTLAGAVAPLLTLAYLVVLGLDKDWHPQSYAQDLDPQLLIALLLLLEALAILCAIALAASTRLKQLPTLVLCAAVFLLGLSSNNLFGRYAEHHVLGAIAYAVLPNLECLWQADALTQGHPLTASHVLWVSGYSALYAAAAVSLAVALFQTREVG